MKDSRPKQFAPLSCECNQTAKAPPKNEVEQLNESIAYLNKHIGELACALEPILLRPSPQEQTDSIKETSATSPLMEHVRDARRSIEILSSQIVDLTRRVRL